jgi:hypothetical protein
LAVLRAAEGTDMTLKCLLVLLLVLAPAPFPRAKRVPTLNMSGSWRVKWGGSDVELDLRPNKTGQFRYARGGGTYDGTWRYDDGARTLYLTLDVFKQMRVYIMTFKEVSATAAAGRVKEGLNWNAEVRLWRPR